jgi:hypothetical protein
MIGVPMEDVRKPHAPLLEKAVSALSAKPTPIRVLPGPLAEYDRDMALITALLHRVKADASLRTRIVDLGRVFNTAQAWSMEELQSQSLLKGPTLKASRGLRALGPEVEQLGWAAEFVGDDPLHIVCERLGQLAAVGWRSSRNVVRAWEQYYQGLAQAQAVPGLIPGIDSKSMRELRVAMITSLSQVRRAALHAP